MRCFLLSRRIYLTMPASSTTPRISPDEWLERKHRILELYCGPNGKLLGSDGVIEMMRREGFIATKAQYELKIKAWGVRKNVKKSEWQKDQIPPDIAISDTRKKRAMRRYAPRGQRAEELVTHDDGHIAQGSTSTLPSTEVVSFENFANEENLSAAELDNRAINMILYAETEGVNPDQNLLPYGLTAQQENHPPLRAYQPLDSGSLSSQVPTRNPLVSSPRSFDAMLACLDQSHINNLLRPCYLGLNSENHLPSIKIADQLIKDIFSETSATSAHGIVLNINPFMLASQFLADINEFIPTTRSSNANAECSPVNIRPALGNFLSMEPFVGEESSQIGTLKNEVIPIARLHSRLIGSIINRATDPSPVPAAGIIKFLTTRGAMPSWLFQFLTSGPTPMTKSLAKNLFQKALEADHVDLIMFLLDCGALEDVHEMVCLHNGERYTPLQLAAMKQSLRVVKWLIEKGVDVNKVSSSNSDCRCNALWMLIQYNNTSKSTLADKFLLLVDAFLEKNATVSVHSILTAARTFTDPRLAIRLIKKSAFQAPQSLMSDMDTLEYIIKYLREEDATSMIKLLTEQCHRIGGDILLFHLSSNFNKVLNEAVVRGYKGVVEALFPYTSSPNEILQTATATSNQEIIDFILRKNPELKGAKDDIIAALRSGDQYCLHSLEERGVLKRLQSGPELRATFQVALKVGNLEYATKIMDLDPGFEFADDDNFDLASALSVALTHGFDDIAWKLLAMGATDSFRSGATYGSMSLLYVAIDKRKPEFVEAIIESGFGLDIIDVSVGGKDSVLEAAVEWGDDSVLNGIWEARSYTIHPSTSLLKLVIEKGRRDFFWKIIESCIPETNLWHNNAIRVAIELEDIPLLETLVARGVRIDNGDLHDDDLLQDAIEDYPSMVNPLLEQFRKAYSEGYAGDGYSFITSVVRKYPNIPNSLDTFFTEDIVTADVLLGKGERETLLETAIAYYESPDISLIERLLTAGRDINGRSDVNRPVYLHPYGPVNQKTTALLTAIKVGSIAIIKLLIENEARVNEPARFGIRFTPLQKAAEVNNLEIVRFLLDNGADVNAAPAKFNGATALQFAAIHGNCKMAITLLHSGADLNIPPPQGPRGRWPLEGAAEHGRLDMIQLLWNANCGPFKDEQCRKGMRLAERNGHTGCRDLIKELMARPSIDYHMDLSMWNAE
ncbi:uncharacterized protein F4807DRAFT_84349 [Annulohypoxylon truncatum]|uniref:uncharacterized protein n=1 Tax=Annulohypoxylon truncatum TaxID=327061 RepID=UPI002008BF20|nr:uncharacterized protein F4807DRAFT_84349 [Annulohypoxylon truncatum]KAI1209617.1 hypothetical protein F4807DRAFT_84349 [Annulohypoxylon truncatum]